MDEGKDTKEAKEFATISYVSIPYTEISDSTVKVTDADINDYVSKHKDMFKQEEGRYIIYLSVHWQVRKTAPVY